MNVTEYIENTKKEVQETRRLDNIYSKREYKLLIDNKDLIEKLPYDISYLNSGGKKLYFQAYCSSDENVKSLIAEIRKILGIKRSEKVLNPITGKITYITENEIFKVSVFGGSVPDNCKLIEEESTYTSTRYTMKCI
jgi:hypothetical protein